MLAAERNGYLTAVVKRLISRMRKPYFENLDGLRFFCFLSIFFFHSFATEYDSIRFSGPYQFIKFGLFGSGNLGVNFFFVLSGFLITYFLIEEKNARGEIELKKFWIRRVLRICPLFYFSVAFGFIIFPILKMIFGQVPNETASLPFYLIFLNNFDVIRHGLPDASILGVLWSVAVEEQFYLLWPVALYLIPVRNYWIFFAAVMIGSNLFRNIYAGRAFIEFHTLSGIGDLTMGALAAWLALSKKKFLNFFENVQRGYIVMIYSVFLLLYLFHAQIFTGNYILGMFERDIIALFIVLIILEQNYATHSLFKVSRLKIISRLGRYTYGFYCLHFIGILTATTLSKLIGFNSYLYSVLIFETTVAFLVTLILGFLSYRYLESPFLRLKGRFASL